MNLYESLNALERKNLIIPSDVQPELQYLFRHSLVQEAAYDSLLKSDRKRLHHYVGEAIENLYPDRIDELSPILGYHFQSAGDDTRAVKYFRVAGKRAISSYAVREAVQYFTRAIDSSMSSTTPDSDLYHARGSAYAILGEYSKANNDFEFALDIARKQKNHPIEWQTLIDLGMLWSKGDYSRTETYYLQAMDLAMSFGDPALLGHSMNRLGNWNLNVENIEEALHFHQSALKNFSELNDTQGIAETYDFLGMTSFVSGNLSMGADYQRQSINLFKKLGNQQRVAHGFASMGLRSNGSYTSQPLQSQGDPLPEVTQDVYQALKICQDIGWRSGEAYAYMHLCRCLGPQGKYDQAYKCGKAGLRIAQEIQHDQWTSITFTALGQLYTDLLAPNEAADCSRLAHKAAVETGSLFLTRTSVAVWAFSELLQGNLEGAADLLKPVFNGEILPNTLSGRWNWSARVKLALARHDSDEAIHILEKLHPPEIYMSPEIGKGIPFLALMYAEALLSQNKYEIVESVLRSAQSLCTHQGSQSLLWRVHRLLTRLYYLQGDNEKSSEEHANGIAIVKTISETIPEENIRRIYLERVDNSWLEGYLG